MKPKSSLHIKDGPHLYEVFLTGTLITRITRYFIERNTGCETLSWDELDDVVKDKIEQELKGDE